MNPGLGEALSTPPPDSKIPPLGSFIVGLPFPFYKCRIPPHTFYKCDILVMLNCWIPVPLWKWVPHHVEKEGCCSPEPPGAPAEKSKTKQTTNESELSSSTVLPWAPSLAPVGMIVQADVCSCCKLDWECSYSPHFKWPGYSKKNLNWVFIVKNVATCVKKPSTPRSDSTSEEKKKNSTAEPFNCETSFPTALLFWSCIFEYIVSSIAKYLSNWNYITVPNGNLKNSDCLSKGQNETYCLEKSFLIGTVVLSVANIFGLHLFNTAFAINESTPAYMWKLMTKWVIIYNQTKSTWVGRYPSF